MLRKGSMSLREDVCMEGSDGSDGEDLGWAGRCHPDCSTWKYHGLIKISRLFAIFRARV